MNRYQDDGQRLLPSFYTYLFVQVHYVKSLLEAVCYKRNCRHFLSKRPTSNRKFIPVTKTASLSVLSWQLRIKLRHLALRINSNSRHSTWLKLEWTSEKNESKVVALKTVIFLSPRMRRCTFEDFRAVKNDFHSARKRLTKECTPWILKVPLSTSCVFVITLSKFRHQGGLSEA